MNKKSFVFYVSWNDAIKKMDEQQLRRFIDNLCNYAEGNDITLESIVDEIMWSQVQPLLDHNERKRQKRIENGKKGGAPVGNSNATKNNLNQANQTETSVEGRGMKDEGRGMKDEGRGMKDEGRGMKDEVEKDEVENVEEEVKTGDITIPDKLLEIKQIIDNGGWGTLHPKDARYWYDNKYLLNNLEL